MNDETSRDLSIGEFAGHPALELRAPDGAVAVVLLHGAQLVSWLPAGGSERIYLSPRADYRADRGMRGGIPVVFPQFADTGPLPRHGFVREREWECVDAQVGRDDALAVLRLGDDRATRALWPYGFEAELTVRVGGSRLDVELGVRNTGQDPLAFTAALHTYLQVGNLSTARLLGLERLRYHDKVRGTEQVAGSEALRVDGEVDRVYFDAARPVQLQDELGALTVSAEGFADVVVWNPGRDKGAALPDLPVEGWRNFVCVEAAAIGTPVRLAGGAEWAGRQSLVDESVPGPRA